MHFLIDGYNLLFFHLTPDESLKKTREEFVLLLDKKLQTLNIKATIIFDGFNQIGKRAEYQHFESVTVVFSPKGQNADEYILEQLSGAKKPNEITVITADNHLAQQARNLGAKSQSPKSFLKQIAKKHLEKETAAQNQKEQEDSKANIERLLSLFEKKLQENELDF